VEGVKKASKNPRLIMENRGGARKKGRGLWKPAYYEDGKMDLKKQRNA